MSLISSRESILIYQIYTEIEEMARFISIVLVWYV